MKLVSLIGLTIFLAQTLVQAKPETTLPLEHLGPFLKEHCVKCHGPEKEKGDLRFDQLSIDLSHSPAREQWEDILYSLKEKEMPPEEEPQPTDKDTEKVVALLEKYINSVKTQVPQEATPNAPQLAEDKKDSKSKTPLVSVNKPVMQKFLGNYCIECHGPDKEKGDVRFDHVSFGISDSNDAVVWQDVLDVLNSGEMPPKKATQPKREELLSILSGLTKTLHEAKERMADHGGVYTMRRLNRREYLATAKHLFGIHFDPSIVPDDYKIEQFDTIGAAQSFSYRDVDLYYDLGKKVIEAGFDWSAKKYEKPTTKKIEAEWITRNTKSDKYRNYPKHKQGHFLYYADFQIVRAKIDTGNDPRGEYKIEIAAATVPDSSPERHFLSLSDNGRDHVQKVTGTYTKPKVLEYTLRAPMFRREGTRYYAHEAAPSIRSKPFQIYLKRIQDKSEFAAIWIDWYSTTGPFYSEESNFFGDLIKKYKNDPSNASQFIYDFAYEAFRHQEPPKELIDGLTQFFTQRQKEGSDFKKAMSETLGLVLASPSFLYHKEETTSIGQRKELSDRSFAVRLAYFLWSSPPDETLYKLAESGQLRRLSVLKKQIARMLEDEKAKAFYEGFMDQWFDIERFKSITIPQEKYPLFNSGVRSSAAREVTEFFKCLAENNLPLSNLIDSDFVVVNAHMAHYYGLKGKYTNEYKPYKLPRGSQRGGLLGQAAFLLSGSNGIVSSPVVRGTMILEKFLNNPPPPPPPNVPELGANIKKPLSNREMVKIHQTQEACASCHSRIDPIGFGLENFNAIGKWQTHERVGNKDVPVEKGGKLISGRQYKDAKDLKRLLLTQKHKFATGFVEDLLEYGTGRTMVFSDQLHIEKVVMLSRQDGYKLIDVLTNLTSSKIFKGK